MSDNIIKVTVTTPKGIVISDKELVSINIPGQEGDIGIYDDHSPLISTLRPGIIYMRVSSEITEKYFVKKGIVEVENNKVNLITDFIESQDKIDADRAEKAMKRASDRLAKKPEGTDIKRAYDALKRAEYRLLICGRNL